ncbi:MAG: carboxypeptidase regulatory-like domain-containing protein, partial [Planctomycetota bacterium]
VTVTPPAGSVYAGRTFNDILVNSDLTRNFILRRKTDLPPIGPQVQANVFDESSRRPIPGASVRLQRAGSGGATAASGTTSTSGQVALALAEPGSYLANVNAVGYTPRRIELTATAGRVTVLNAAMRRTSEPIIPGGPSLMTVTGWVVTPSTGAVRPTPTPGRSDAFDRGRFQPVADASVQWYFPNEGGLPGAVRLVRTDAKGRFRFEGIREDTYQVTVRASGYASRSVRVNVRDGMRDPVVVLTPQRSIRPTDDPSASKTFVKLTVLTRTQPPQVIPGARLDIKGNRDAASGTSDASGRFTTRLAPGQYTVRASHGKYQSTSQQLTVASSAVNQQVYLTPIGTTPGRQSDERSLTVHVTDQSRSPVAGAIVEVLPQQRGRFGLPAKPLRRGTTSTSGSFRTTMRPGLYTLRVSGRGFQTATGTLGITTSDVVKDIRVLRRSVSPSQDEMSLVVMVVDQTRKGVAGATVTVMRGNQAIKTGTTNTSGRYQTTVPPGSYAIKASGAMINPGGTQATVQNSNVTATVNVTRTSSASSGDSGRTQIKYLAQVRAPGSTTWTTIGTYTNRKLAEAALQRAKMPVKSQTRVVPQRMPVIRGPIQRRVFPTEIRR